MEVIRGRERDCRQEIRCAVERGRTRTTRRLLVEEGFEAVLTRKYNANSARPRIFDGVAEAKLITLACGPAPEGHAKWSLRLLEDKVVELHIVERASDNTIGRTLKKTFSSRI